MEGNRLAAALASYSLTLRCGAGGTVAVGNRLLAPRTFLCAAVALTALSALSATGLRLYFESQVDYSRAAEARLQYSLVQVTSAEVPAIAEMADFTQTLSETTDLESIVSSVQGAAKDVHVAITSVTSSRHPPTQQLLGRTKLTFTMRGTYPALKRVVAEVLTRNSGIIMQGLSLAPIVGSGDLDARLVVLHVIRPLASAPASRSSQ